MRNHRWLWRGGLLLVGFCAYANSLGGPFIFDDVKNIRDRDEIHALDSIGLLLTTTQRPALMLSLALNYAQSGGEVWSFHATNLAGHLLAGLLLFGLIRRTLLLPGAAKSLRGRADLLAFSSALLWIAHPLQTQSVTYIIQRSESFMGLSLLLALYCLARGSQSQRPGSWYLGSVMAVALGIGFKGVIVTAPLIILCYDRVFLTKQWKTLLRKRWAYYAGLVALTSLLVIRMAHVFDPSSSSAVGKGCGITSWEYLRSQAGVIVHYLRLAIWPDRLCLDYGWPVAQSAAEIYLPGSLVLLLLAGSLAALWRCPRGGFLGIAFFLLLAPTSSFLPIIDLAFEHRMYLPLACLVVLAVLLLETVSRRLLTRERRQDQTLLVVVGILALCLAIRTHLRNRDYQSADAIWRSVVRCAPHNPRGWYNLGVAVGDRGDAEGAMAMYRRALSVQPDHARSHYNLARVLAERGQRDQAESHYRLALAAKANYTDASYNLALLYASAKDFQRGIEQYERTLEIDANYRNASYNLASLYLRTKQFEKAIRQFRRTLEIDPHDASASYNLAGVFLRTGQTSNALAQYRQTLELDPRHHKARLVLATMLADAGRQAEAIQCYEEEIKRHPRDAALHDQFGMFLARRGDFEQARQKFLQAISIDPHHAAAHAHLGMVLHELGQPRAAARSLRKALDLQPGLQKTSNLLARVLADAQEQPVMAADNP